MQVLLKGAREIKNIINMHKITLPLHSSYHNLHDTFESSRCITQPKRQLDEFEKALVGYEKAHTLQIRANAVL